MKHEGYMQIALDYAQKAYDCQEVPVGAIVVTADGTIIGYGYNDREHTQDATRHAEIIAIQMATQQIKSWRLENCTLYVTLEPCPMCSGAIINSRIKTVVFGATDPKAGCVGSVMDILRYDGFNHQPEIIAGVLETACSDILKKFFKTLRHK